MKPTLPTPGSRHSFRPLLFAPPQGHDALPPTVREPPTAAHRLGHEARGANDSHVRLRALPPAANIDWLEAHDLLDELCEEQLALGMNLACLEQAVPAGPHDASARAAFGNLQARIEDLGSLRDALAATHSAAVDRSIQRAFVACAPLSDYLRGLYAWANAVTRALEHLVASLRAVKPDCDWALYRWRILEAKNFHFDELHDDIRAQIVGLPPAAERAVIADAVERLFATARTLEARLDQRFV